MNDALSLCRPYPTMSESSTSGMDHNAASLPLLVKSIRPSSSSVAAITAAEVVPVDLVALGITLAGHQKRILSCAAALRVPSGSRITSTEEGHSAVQNEASFV